MNSKLREQLVASILSTVSAERAAQLLDDIEDAVIDSQPSAEIKSVWLSCYCSAIRAGRTPREADHAADFAVKKLKEMQR